ncbi:MAG: dCTP deaminase [Phycisphaerae bacterium]
MTARRRGALRSGVLTRKEILRRLRRRVKKATSLVITPRPKDEDFDRDSVDLRLGSYFFVPRAHRAPCFVPGLTSARYLYSEQYVPLGSYLVLPAHHTVLGATREYLKLPSDVSGEILTKSSWARTFITIETAPWIHPLYRGCLTLEIANVSNTPVVIYPGVKIAQLILIATTQDTAAGERDTLDGTYIGPVRPEPASLETPQAALRSLGVEPAEMSYPFDEYMSHKECRDHVISTFRDQGFQV